MSGMFIEAVRKIPLAERLYPELKKTSLSGIYQKSPWTVYADHLLLHQPNMEPDINPANYVNWLDWYYELVANNSQDNPLERSVRDLSDGGRINALWVLSFTEKSFEKEIPYSNEYIELTKHEVGGLILERELIPDRFGDTSYIERRYEDGVFSTLTTIVNRSGSNNKMILTIDDLKSYSYQLWYRRFSFKPLDLHHLMNLNKPIFDHLEKNTRMINYEI